MPNFDGGHYFLTALLPLKNDELILHGGVKSSAVHMVRRALSITPTACQSPPTVALGLNSPFARTMLTPGSTPIPPRTHFARFVVIDDIAYNGRDPVDAIRAAAKGIDPITAAPTDSLPYPYLLFVADFDARSGDVAELRDYLAYLWRLMEPELRAIMGYCTDFGRRVTDAASFSAYIEACQVETTMPFNDYWTGAPPLASLGALPVVAAVLGAVLVIAGAVAFWWQGHSGWIALASGVFGVAAVIWLLYRFIMARARVPFPAAPNSDLPAVLKALYLQQHFTRFAIDAQGRPDAEVQRLFAGFVATHKPHASEPTQGPGVLKAS
jgi:hypothetical protein